MEDTILIVHGNSVIFLNQEKIEGLKKKFPGAVIWLRNNEDEARNSFSEIKETSAEVLSDESGEMSVDPYLVSYRLVKVRHHPLPAA